jgi:hypothetical protein
MKTMIQKISLPNWIRFYSRQDIKREKARRLESKSIECFV